MTCLRAFIEGVGLIGPGLVDWPQAAQVLAGKQPYVPQRTVLPSPVELPSIERRRTGPTARVALAVGYEAVRASKRDAATLNTVFTASGGDGQNCHAVCETLASEDRALSPTRFHNSVHNAPAGYWSIATRSMMPSNVLCAYDGSFAAGLMESACQVVVDAKPTLLIAFDADYPAPLSDVRPIADPFGVSLVLVPEPSEHTVARIDIRLTDAPGTTMGAPVFEALRLNNPAARALPLLELLATRSCASIVLDYLEDVRLAVDVTTSDSKEFAS